MSSQKIGLTNGRGTGSWGGAPNALSLISARAASVENEIRVLSMLFNAAFMFLPHLHETAPNRSSLSGAVIESTEDRHIVDLP
jgi:hypothetical protein